MSGRTLLGLVAVWVATIGVAWGVVGLPEHCPEVTPLEARAAATATVGWFQRNQLDDGRWVYRYNLDTDEVDLFAHTVRHSGVTMSLYQAHRAGIPGALEVADRGAEWSLGHLGRHDDFALVSPTRYAPSGGTALLLAGLVTRRMATSEDSYDEDMYAMGRFLVAMTEPTGAVLETWDTHEDAAVPGQYSLFFTGEAFFALSLLAQLDPTGEHGDWTGTADRIATYLATERDEVEDRFPPTSDHWSAYGLATTSAGGQPLDSDQVAYAERLAEIFGIQVRYESQRTGSGLNRWVLRGPEALGAGVGTLGEGLGSLWMLAGEGGPLEEHRPAIGERLRCTAGILYERQVDPARAQETEQPELSQGAWFRLGWTQQDDQQHALSALLLAIPALTESERQVDPPTGDDSVVRVLWLMVISVALVNPVRVRRLVAGAPAAPPLRMRLAIGAGGAFAGLAVAALATDPVLDAIEVSPPTAMIAAGLVVGLTAIVDLVRPRVEPLLGVSEQAARFVPLLVPGLLRPAAVVLSLAASAHVSVVAALAMAAVTAVSGLVVLDAADDEQQTTLEDVMWRACAVLATVGGVALMVDGVFSI